MQPRDGAGGGRGGRAQPPMGTAEMSPEQPRDKAILLKGEVLAQ